MFFYLFYAMLYLFHTPPQAKYLFTFFRHFFCFKVVSNLTISIDDHMEVNKTSETRLHKFKHHLMMASEPRGCFFKAIIYLFTTCPSDNYLVPEFSV